jgi:hypothetical protein
LNLESLEYKPETLLLQPTFSAEDNIKVKLKEMWYQVVEWISLLQNGDSWRAIVCTVIKFGVQWKAGNFVTS